MHYPDDTIAAISTPVGQGGIGIVRISGPQSVIIADKIFRSKRGISLSKASAGFLIYGHIVNPESGDIIDEVLAVLMRSPRSYTREDVVEINCHGGMISVRKILELVLNNGARLAEPGEFTKRAFLNGRISLSGAEAVLDLINAKTDESLRIAMEQLKGGLEEKISEVSGRLMETCAFIEAYIDFPEEDIEPAEEKDIHARLRDIKQGIQQLSQSFHEARFFREGLAVAIIGRPNVGKSSLLNALLQKDRAIVTEIPGTTRDQIEEFINISGLPIRIIDTAGIRASQETLELEGIRRSLNAIENADFVIALFDGNEALSGEDRKILEMIKDKKALVALNKSDLPAAVSPDSFRASGKQCLSISALTGKGLEELKSAVFTANLGNWKEERDGVIVTNMRHKQALDKAGSALERAIDVLSRNQPLEILSIELRDALNALGEITGDVTTEDILDKIFNDFCIGK